MGDSSLQEEKTMTALEMMEALGFPADEEKAAKLTEYNAMVIAMSKKVNLTGIKDVDESLIKNVYDSLTVYDEKYFPEKGKVLDLGTGAGFPGVPLAILRPDMLFVLVDSIQKKLTFVEDACKNLGIKNVKCVHMRAEEGGRRRKTREAFDVVTARAVKAMPIISEWALPFVKVGGVFAAMKGPGAMEEMKQAGKILRELHAELSEKKEFELPGGDKRCILYLKKTAPCPKTYPRKVGIAEKKPIIGE
jgi:16S rRNA (guanine527-N7)-methyltransferase